MKNKVELVIFLLFSFTFLVYIFPFIFVDAAEFQSGVTINAPSSSETETICDDTIDNDNDGKIDADDEDCAATSSQPGNEFCGNGEDDNGDGDVDEVPCIFQPIGMSGEICANSMDDDGDGDVDEVGCTPQQGVMGEICANSMDDNGDGDVDEPDCTQDGRIYEYCNNGQDDDGDGFEDEPPCRPPPIGMSDEICANSMDDDGDGIADEPEPDCTPPAVATGGTCGLQILSGVPINYGQLNAGQPSADQVVQIKNEGTSQTPAKIMIKGDDWIGEPGPPPTPAGPNFGAEATHVAIAPNLDWGTKNALSRNGWELGQLTGGQSLPVYFQFKVPVGIVGAYHQDVTIDLLC
jgi:hypothetical protein